MKRFVFGDVVKLKKPDGTETYDTIGIVIDNALDVIKDNGKFIAREPDNSCKEIWEQGFTTYVGWPSGLHSWTKPESLEYQFNALEVRVL